jgi:hypothetical protein
MVTIWTEWRGSILGQDKDLSRHNRLKTGPRGHQPPGRWAPGDLFPWWNGRSLNLTTGHSPSVYMVWCLIKLKDNFTGITAENWFRVWSFRLKISRQLTVEHHRGNTSYKRKLKIFVVFLALGQCFSTFFRTRRTIFCRESLRHTNVWGGNTAGDSGLHTHNLPSAVVISGCLLHFSTTYLCERGFSALTNMNTKREWLLSLEQEMHVCLSSIRPQIELLCKKRQAQVSH